MKKLGQGGFGLIEALIIIIILGIIGGTGFYVYKANKNTDESLSNSGNSTDIKKSPAATQKDPYKDWKTYSSGTEKLSFKYPSDWSFLDTSSMDQGADSASITAPSKAMDIIWQSQRTGLGGACTSENTAVNGESVKMPLGDCPYFFVQTKDWLPNAGLNAVFGVMTLDGDQYTPWCALQDEKGILASQSNIGYLLFQGKNNDVINNGRNYGPAHAGLICGKIQSLPDKSAKPLTGSKSDATKFWDTTEGQQIKLILKSATY